MRVNDRAPGTCIAAEHVDSDGMLVDGGRGALVGDVH